MKSPLLDLHLSKGLGDSICATPSLRKLYYAYGKKISVLTDHVTIFDQEKPELNFIKTYTRTPKDKIYIFPDSRHAIE